MLEVKSLSKSYNRVNILRDLNFTLPAGEILLVTGKNGSGKTTLLKILAGLIKRDAGGIRFDGIDIEAKTRWLARIAFVAHTPLFADSMRVFEIFRFYSKFFQIPENFLSEISNILETEKIKDFSFAKLSAGEKKRVNLTVALARRVELLLLDEPLVNIDLAFRNRVIKLLSSLKDETSMIITTHNLRPFKDLKPRVALLKHSFFYEPPENSDMKFDEIASITEKHLLS